MAKLYKDFNKDVKDLLNKNHEAVGFWKIDHKSKNKSDKTFFINPKADSVKGVSCEVEYNVKEYDLKTKTVVANGKFAPKVTWECVKDAKNIKVDVGVDRLASDAAYDVEFTGTYEDFKINNVLTKGKSVVGASFKANDTMQVGAGATLALTEGVRVAQWNAAAMFTEKDRQLVVSTIDAKKFTAGLILPVDFQDRKLKVATQVDFDDARKVAVTVGTQMACLCDSANTIKVRVSHANEQLTVGLAYIMKMNANWTAAISMGCKDFDCNKICNNFGISFTHE